MTISDIDPRLPLVQDADHKERVILVRVDRNRVKKMRSWVQSLIENA